MEPLMTEPLERVSHIERLPIFYTSQMVLLPFEPNQKLTFGKPAARQLLQAALHSDERMFGVTYFDETVKPVLDRPPTGSVGTVAFIHSVGLSKGGGKIAKISGIARYQIEEYVELDKPYPVAEVTFFKDEPEDEKMLLAESIKFGQEMAQVVNKVARQINKPMLVNAPAFHPVPMSFIAASLMMFGRETRQSFLKIRSTSERFAACRELLKEFDEHTDVLDNQTRFAREYRSLRSNPKNN